MNTKLTGKYQRLLKTLNSYKRVILAYSGGVDSTFLLHALIEALGTGQILAVIGKSNLLGTGEYDQAIETAANMGVNCQTVVTDELADARFAANDPLRCYYCRCDLFAQLRAMADEQEFDAALCGVNADDLDDYRPGRKAAAEFDIKAPLADAGLTKKDIRDLCRQAGLNVWDKPASPCLATRMAYGLAITPQRLEQVDTAERVVRALTGITELRVRHHGDLARIEVDKDCINAMMEKRADIAARLHELGFTYVSVDMDGFRSGSGNEVLGDK